jgi:hypothetical protein
MPSIRPGSPTAPGSPFATSAELERVTDVPWIGGTQPPTHPYVVAYNPGSVQNTVTASNQSYTDIDATNLALTFVVPPSGKVLVTLAMRCRVDSGAQYRWRLHDGTGGIAESVHTVLQDSSTANLAAQFRTVEFMLSTDNAGAALVPGAVVTVKWQQATTTNSVVGYAVYGGGAGMATMRVEPVSDRLVESPVTATLTASVTNWPLWLCHDGVTYLGASTSAGLAVSTDECASWTRYGAATFSAAGGVIGAREMDNGEVLVMSSYGTDAGQIFVSSGFAADPSTATFTSTLEATGSTTARFTNGWSVDTYGPLVVAAEYGPKASSTDMARYVYLSQDYGRNWSTIFDLVEQTGESANAHLHGVCYDPWWDAIWVCSGDSTEATGVFVSFDLGESWTEVAGAHKSTTVIALPNCILFGTDAASSNGVYRIPRTSKRYLSMELAYAIDANSSLTVVGQQTFRSRRTPDAPVLMSYLTSDVVSGPGRLVATYDGYTFRQVWTDQGQSYTLNGLYSMVGPSTVGSFYGRLSRSGSDYQLLKLVT